MNTKNLKKIIIAAMFSAVIAVATMIIRIPSPTGYVNFGDCFVLIAGWLLGPFGILAAAIGSALADFLSSYTIYIIPTFIIKGCMALCAWALFKAISKGGKKLIVISYILSAVVAEIIMVVGYFVFEAIFFNPMLAIQSILGNAFQGLTGIVTGTLLIGAIKKLNIHII